ncbi:hypothetical protein S40285_10377 [Stachybotrys chlorohalonatus IBT 40285]|uniref:Uncharacterized protein n=1 Tax=Stachybotrys chlorohalonatus (strain IBT 40285) TaxID=1283841 RepID=A0A084QEQ9_STAC4|nr:hypothetical protein S40285_10377 [Stachybotrys chlorohalonata IBT 40285]
MHGALEWMVSLLFEYFATPQTEHQDAAWFIKVIEEENRTLGISEEDIAWCMKMTYWAQVSFSLSGATCRPYEDAPQKACREPFETSKTVCVRRGFAKYAALVLVATLLRRSIVRVVGESAALEPEWAKPLHGGFTEAWAECARQARS